MSKWKYTHIKLLLPEIKAMPAEGKSHREIEEHFGLTGERPVHLLLMQEHRREKKLAEEGIYRHKPRTFEEANELIDRYIHFFIRIHHPGGALFTARCAGMMLTKK